MYLNFVLKGLVVGSAVSLSLLLSQLSYAQEPSSFRSWNYSGRYIRHRLSLGYIDPIVASDKLGRKDATFRTCSRAGRQMPFIRICQLSRLLFETPELQIKVGKANR